MESAIPEFGQKTDEELAALAQRGSEEACAFLLDRYKITVREIARTYFLAGAEGDDVIQEGMIGLYKAVRGYQPQQEASFKTFAVLCIRRQIVSAVRTASRLKNNPLNDYVSLSVQDDADAPQELSEHAEQLSDPAETVIRQESEALMRDKLNELLSPLERTVLALFLEGRSYREIAEHTGKDLKSVDNALRRVRKKLNVPAFSD